MSGNVPGGSATLASVGPSRRSLAPGDVETDTTLALDLARSRLRRHLDSCPDCLLDAPRCAEGHDLLQRVADLADELRAEAQVSEFRGA